jgi:hypothetical protein
MLVRDGTGLQRSHLLRDNMTKDKICGALDASCMSSSDTRSKAKNLTNVNFKKKDICSKENLATHYLQ